MSEVRIIGIGSPFGDDRIGWDAIDAIDKSGLLARFPAASVRTFCCGAPATGLLPLLSGADAAILIDAMRSDALPGTLRRIDVRELQPDRRKISSHGLGVSETIALAETLDMLPATLVLYGIEVRDVDGQGRSADDGHAAIPALLRAIAGELQNLVRKGVLHRRPAQSTSDLARR